ncbi:MAG TPA: hypothetical protein VH143_20185 [Kofleriaceae bacterium]|nr:hypothetical protein [Kofleriaceae bacterium]
MLAHEVAHTVQQQGGTATRQNKLEVSGPQDAAEHEADRAADAMVSGGQASISGFGGVQRRVYRDFFPDLVALGQAQAGTTQTQNGGASNGGVAPTTNTQVAVGGPQTVPVAGSAQSPVSGDSDQFLRPTPTPIDPADASALNSIAIGQQAFGASNDWKKSVDWPSFTAWINSVPQVESTIENSINPKIGSDLALVQHTHDNYKQRLGEAFAKEQGQIEQIVKTDTTVQTQVTHINTQSNLIKTEFAAKAAALDDVSAATDEAISAAAAGDQQQADADKQKQAAYLTQLNTEKAAAKADLEKIPELIANAAKLAAAVATGQPEAAEGPAEKLASALIMGAYKGWVDKDVDAKYETQINNVQTKIRDLEAKIQNAKTTEVLARVRTATSHANAAALRVQASNAKIKLLQDDIDQTRVTLGIYISQKYKQVASFKLASDATNAMKPLLAKYLVDLQSAKTLLKKLDPWQVFHQQLLTAAGKAAGGNADWMNGGALPQPGQVQKQTPRQEQEVAEVDHYVFAVARVGTYVQTENAHYDAEIEKVESGGYLDFVTQFDQALVGMLPSSVPGRSPG